MCTTLHKVLHKRIANRPIQTLIQEKVEFMLELTLTIGIFLVMIGLVYLLERRTKKRGPLFTGPATRGTRLLALILGLLFAGIFIFEWLSSSEIIIWFPIIALALLGYGFGADGWLAKLQGKASDGGKSGQARPDAAPVAVAIESFGAEEPKSLIPKRLLRFLIIVAVILVVSAVFLYGAYWAATHPSDPLALVFVIAVIVIFVLARFFHVVRALKNLSDRFK